MKVDSCVMGLMLAVLSAWLESNEPAGPVLTEDESDETLLRFEPTPLGVRGGPRSLDSSAERRRGDEYPSAKGLPTYTWLVTRESAMA